MQPGDGEAGRRDGVVEVAGGDAADGVGRHGADGVDPVAEVV
jgi:hypothetical protein